MNIKSLIAASFVITVVEVYFLNEAEEYLQVYVGPLGHHVALLLSGNRTLLQSSLPLQYAIKDRRVAINTSPVSGVLLNELFYAARELYSD